MRCYWGLSLFICLVLACRRLVEFLEHCIPIYWLDLAYLHVFLPLGTWLLRLWLILVLFIYNLFALALFICQSLLQFLHWNWSFLIFNAILWLLVSLWFVKIKTVFRILIIIIWSKVRILSTVFTCCYIVFRHFYVYFQLIVLFYFFNLSFTHTFNFLFIFLLIFIIFGRFLLLLRGLLLLIWAVISFFLIFYLPLFSFLFCVVFLRLNLLFGFTKKEIPNFIDWWLTSLADIFDENIVL